MIDFRDKVTCIFGLRKSGKSTLAHYINQQYGNKAMVYDTQHEFPVDGDYFVYKPQDKFSTNELMNTIFFYTKNRKQSTPKIDMITIDEGNRFAEGGNAPLDYRINDLNDSLRHEPYQVGVIWIARRPTQLNAHIVNLADIIICFQLSGLRDVQYLNNLYNGLGYEVQKLKPYHACMLSGNKLTYIAPITPDAVWKKGHVGVRS